MEISPKGVNVRAESETGAFYAIQSLKQLAQGTESIKCCTIVDYPEFSWRGLMLDVSRYYLDKDFVRKQIDAMAALKMNTLHMHLTDDAGWNQCPRCRKLMEVYLSDDGNNWSKAGSAICQVNERDASMAYYPMRVQLEGDARYIRITAKRKTHSYCVWLFIDEIIVK